MKRMSLITMLAAAALTITAVSAEASKGKNKAKREAKRAAELSRKMEKRFPGRARHDHAPKGRERVWVPGHHEMRRVERQLPDRYEWRTVTVRLPDRYEWRSERVWVEGAPVYREKRYKIRSGRWEARVKIGRNPRASMVWVPAQYGTRRVRVDTAGRWEIRRVRVRVDGGTTTRREQIRVPGETYTARECVWVPGHYEIKRKQRQTWVQGAAYGAREQLVTGGNHGGFGFSLSIARR